MFRLDVPGGKWDTAEDALGGKFRCVMVSAKIYETCIVIQHINAIGGSSIYASHLFAQLAGLDRTTRQLLVFSHLH